MSNSSSNVQFFRSSSNFGLKLSGWSQGSMTLGFMTFGGVFDPFFPILQLYFDLRVKKVDFSNFWLFFTFFDVEWAYDDQFSSPVWQMKGMFSTPKDIW